MTYYNLCSLILEVDEKMYFQKRACAQFIGAFCICCQGTLVNLTKLPRLSFWKNVSIKDSNRGSIFFKWDKVQTLIKIITLFWCTKRPKLHSIGSEVAPVKFSGKCTLQRRQFIAYRQLPGEGTLLSQCQRFKLMQYIL